MDAGRGVPDAAAVVGDAVGEDKVAEQAVEDEGGPLRYLDSNGNIWDTVEEREHFATLFPPEESDFEHVPGEQHGGQDTPLAEAAAGEDDDDHLDEALLVEMFYDGEVCQKYLIDILAGRLEDPEAFDSVYVRLEKALGQTNAAGLVASLAERDGIQNELEEASQEDENIDAHFERMQEEYESDKDCDEENEEHCCRADDKEESEDAGSEPEEVEANVPISDISSEEGVEDERAEENNPNMVHRKRTISASYRRATKRLKITQKQYPPLSYLGIEPDVKQPVQYYTPRGVEVMKDTCTRPFAAILKRPAKRQHLCHGPGGGIPCSFSKEKANERARAQSGRQCPWCSTPLMTRACSTVGGRRNLVWSLKAFLKLSVDVFTRAIAKLPAEQQFEMHAKALRLPKSVQLMKEACSNTKRRNQLIKKLKACLGVSDQHLESAALLLPEEERESLAAAARRPTKMQQRQAAQAAFIQRESAPTAWKEHLVKHRRAALQLDDENLHHEYQQHCKGDSDRVRRRFYPTAKALARRGVELPAEVSLPQQPENEELGVDGLPDPDDRGASSHMVRNYLRFDSWGMCPECHRLEPRKLKPANFRLAASVECKTECLHYHSDGKSGYSTPQPSEQPRPLRDLSPAIIEALRPLWADPGPYKRAENGYREHTAMTRLVWAEKPVKDKIKGLESRSDRHRARKALRHLLQDEESAYSTFYEEHLRFLRRQAKQDDEEKDSASYKLPLRSIERVGVETAIWPHLYWTTAMCETAIRQENREQGEVSEEESATNSESEDEETDKTIRNSLKQSYLAKVLGPLMGYGTEYALFQFVYDLHLWTKLGSKKNLTSRAPMRVLMKGESFSPFFWRLRHLAVLDMQRQLGMPTFWYTLAPYEWTFPYHEALLHEMESMLRSRLHLPGPETLHLAHSLRQLVEGFLTGRNQHWTKQKSRNWQQHILQGRDGRTLVVNFAARLEFQDGKRKKGTQAYHGRGSVHIHVLTWHDEQADEHNLHEVLSATVPVEDAVMTAFVLGSQPSHDDSGWPVHEGASRPHPECPERVELHHTQTDKDNGLRGYIPVMTAATKGSHQDAQCADGRGMLLKYLATYLPKFSDSFAQEWLNEGGSDVTVARKILFDYHPLEPEMWLQLASKQQPSFLAGGSFYPIIAPYPGMEKKPDFVQKYEDAQWRGNQMTLLEFLRKSNKDGKIIRYVREAWKRNGQQPPEEEGLQKFAREHKTRGQKLIAADTVWRLNDTYYGQWLALNVPFRRLEDFHVEEIKTKVPDRMYYLALALHWKPDYWESEDRITEDMKLEACFDAHMKTVMAMIKAKSFMIREYLAGRVPEDRTTHAGNAPLLGGPPREAHKVKQDPKQEQAIKHVQKNIDRALEISAAKSQSLERLLHEAEMKGYIVAIMGPPGTGKTRVARHLLVQVAGAGELASFTFPTGVQQSRMRAALQGHDIKIDTCHGFYMLHKQEEESLPLLEGFILAGVDEFPQLSQPDWERIVRVWMATGKTCGMMMLGDFHQLPSVAGTDARQSTYWQKIRKVHLTFSFRSDDDWFNAKLNGMRIFQPKCELRNRILRGHKAWNHPGGPTDEDLRMLFRRHSNTKILVVSRKAAHEVGVAAARVTVGRRRLLAILPADYDSNPENYDKGKLRKDRQPLPALVEIRHGLRVQFTKNIDKDNDQVNG